MDDILKRLGNVEASVTDLRLQVGTIATTMPGLATAASVSKIETVISRLATAESVSKIEAIIPSLATAASVSRIEAIIPTLATKADLSDMHAATIKWIVATALTSTGLATTLAFAIAKFVH